ncbi:MAG: hypothetical protein MN733_36665, partial [Nitrososphaera sp.]|nr:hypothetical protein [Nitrososphaera sp.]
VKPRMEIDVVGMKAGLAIAVDCKHWKRSSIASIAHHSKKQAVRAARLAREDKRLEVVVPAVLTLHVESVRFIEGIPLVPISQFRTFVMDLKEHLSEVCALERD